MAPADADAVVCEVRIGAPPEAVFPFFTDPEKMTRWIGLRAALDPRSGGLFRVDINGADIARGEYVVVDPPRRVVFTWGWEESRHGVPPGTTRVEVTLAPDGDGTLVRVAHHGLPPPARTPHREGWQHYLPRLATTAAGGDPGPDPWASPA